MASNDEVALRALRREDIVAIFRWKNDRQVLHLTGRDPTMSRSEVTFVEDFEARLRSPIARRLIRGIVAPSGRTVGYVLVFDLDRYRKSAEFGIMIGEKSFWGKGLGTAAARLFLGWVFAGTAIEHLTLFTAPFNKRAQRCFRKCGFRPVTGYRPPEDASIYEMVKMTLSKDEFLSLSASWSRPMPDEEG